MHIVLDWDEKYKKGIIKSEHANLIREHFSVPDEKAGIIRAKYGKKKRFIPSRKYIITDTFRFDVQFYHQILEYLKEINKTTPVSLMVTNELLKNLHKSKFEQKIPLVQLNVIKNGVSHPPRDYQIKACEKVLENGCGIILLSTAGGKSLICGMISKSVLDINPNYKIIISVPTIQLVEQTYSDIISYGVDSSFIGKWSGDYDFDEKAIMVVSTGIVYDYMDSFNKQVKENSLALKMTKEILDKEVDEKSVSDWTKKYNSLLEDQEKLKQKAVKIKKMRDYFERVNLLIIDECHKWKKNSEIESFFKYINTKNVIGLTGTLPENQIDTWNILGKIGPVVFTVPRQELVDRSFISDCEVTILQLHYTNPPDYSNESGKMKYNTEVEYLKTSNFRNEIIQKICKTLSKNILITAQHLDHLNIIYNKLKNIEGKNVYLVTGDVEVGEREIIRKSLEDSDNNIIIAQTTIFSTGLSINNLHYIILASAGKAKVTLIQSIGRSVRLHENKKLSNIFDLTSNNLMYESRHMEKRIKEYEKEGIRYRIKTIREEG